MKQVFVLLACLLLLSPLQILAQEKDATSDQEQIQQEANTTETKAAPEAKPATVKKKGGNHKWGISLYPTWLSNRKMRIQTEFRMIEHLSVGYGLFSYTDLGEDNPYTSSYEYVGYHIFAKYYLFGKNSTPFAMLGVVRIDYQIDPDYSDSVREKTQGPYYALGYQQKYKRMAFELGYERWQSKILDERGLEYRSQHSPNDGLFLNVGVFLF